MTEKRQIRCGVIGYGGAFNMGRQHLQQMGQQEGFVVSAACDLDPARTQEAEKDFPGIRTFNNVDEFLASDVVDLITVITPHNTHAALALQCLNAGKHVITEKPMCITTDEATAMINAAKANNVMLSVYHNRRWDGDYLALRDIVSSGMIGDVFHVEMAMGGYGHPGYWWRSDKKVSGGAFYDWGAHFLDWLLNLIDSPVSQIDGSIQKRVWMDVTNEDHVHSYIRFENGATAEVEMSSINRAKKPRWRVLGTRGAAIHRGDHYEVITDVNGFEAVAKVPRKEGEHYRYYAGIADHLLRGGEVPVSAESARRVISVIEGTEKAAHAGHSIPPAYK